MKIPADRITTLILCKYYPLAAACGRFYITFLRHCRQSKTHLDILKGIVRTCKLSRKINNNEVAFFVEAILDNTPELQDWNTIINELTTVDSNSIDQYLLLEIFCQSLIQTVTGKCSTAREKPRKGHISKITNKSILHIFLSNFCTLITLYGKKKENILLLLEALSVLDFSLLQETAENEKVCKFFKHDFLLIFSIAENDIIGQYFDKFIQTY